MSTEQSTYSCCACGTTLTACRRCGDDRCLNCDPIVNHGPEECAVAEHVVRFDPAVLPCGNWTEVGDGWEVRTFASDEVGTFHVRRRVS